MKKCSGVLCPVFSLPGEYASGNFGKEAYRFVDFLASAGFSVWQVLPFCEPDGYHSPYASPASLCGNADFIDPEELFEKGLLTREELALMRQETPYACEFEKLGVFRRAALKKAFSRSPEADEVDRFFAGREALAFQCEYLARRNGTEPAFERWLQFVFCRQWQALKTYANRKGVRILGDLPFYVSALSADVLEDPSAFCLDGEGRPAKKAGVPPDYFSSEGQLWGNPLYNWEVQKENGYAFWRRRIRLEMERFDGLRLDHFRAFSRAWSIPARASSAREGAWENSPGLELVNLLKKEAANGFLVAENLGTLDNEANRLLEDSGLPGMAVFQFAWDGNSANPHLPHNYTEKTVAYTGTHDNNTLLGFLWEESDAVRQRILRYIGYDGDWNRSYESILRVMLMSAAGMVIFPVQDLAGYGGDTRINTPGKAAGNWAFRLTREALAALPVERFRRMNDDYSRSPNP